MEITQFKIGQVLSAGLYTQKGEKVLDLTDSMCDITFESKDYKGSRRTYFSCPETSFDIKWSIDSVRKLNKIMYGWAAKGPIRRRVLEKLWKIKRKKRNEDRR